MLTSYSEPSVGAGTLLTSVASHTSRINPLKKKQVERQRGQFLWEGRLGKITVTILLAPWNMWWQTTMLITVVSKFIIHLLLGFYLDKSKLSLEIILMICEVFFFIDVSLHVLHTFWRQIRLHMRVYRRSYTFLAYDIISLIPFNITFKKNQGYDNIILISRLLAIGRIYRLYPFFKNVNDAMHRSRKTLFVIEHAIAVILTLHAGTCFWYALHNFSDDLKYKFGYPVNIGAQKLKFDSYNTCWYYCSCRLFNIIFGDTFPLNSLEKWFTAILTLIGFVFIRYRFIGTLAWDLVVENSRQIIFVERYHHMLTYLKLRGAPSWLVEQAAQYKKKLWHMKEGVLASDQLQKLPLSLQMELIFDINVGHFHNTLLFRDTGEAFMRQISLLMRHEIFLEGQYVWSQGVVKNGMIFIKRGVLEMLSDEDDESPMISFKEGTVLGELSLFYSIPAKVTVKAATYLELQVLRRTDFMKAMTEQAFMLQNIRKQIEDRLKSSRRRQEAIEEYDKGDSRLIRTRYRPMKILKNHLAGIEEEDPTFIDDSHMYYKDVNNVRQPKFTSEYLELYQISPNVTTIDYPKICVRANFPWILEPDTDFTHMFDLAHFLMVLYVCIMSPYAAILSTGHSDVDRVLSTVVMAGLLLNIYVQLTTAVVEKNIRKETVREIAEVKMATVGFYLDILSVFPMYIFTDTLDPDEETAEGQIALLFPVLQVWHIWNYLNKWEKHFNSNVKFVCLLKFCLIFMLFCYWSGCILYLFACPRKLCRENSWMAQLIYWETKVFMTNDAKHERPTLSSLAFGTAVFTGTGTSDISPGFDDLFLVCGLFCIGAYLSFFYIANICSLFMLSTQRKLKFKESMRELFYFLSVNHVNEKIKSRVKKFFCVQWYYNNAVSTEELFNDMSANIQQEVLSIDMVESLLYCPLFQECSRDFLQTVAANTRTIVLPDNEIVQHAADIGRDMYILQKGHCNILNQEAKIIATIGPGSHFGVVEMLFGLPKVYTVLTSTNCILLYVEYSALVQCWSTFPDISHPIMKTLEDNTLQRKAAYYEDAKPLTGRMDAKINRIAQEIKESFVVLTGREEGAQYVKAFDKLGVMRHIRYIIIPACITPHGIFLKCWCALRFFVAIFYIFIIPYNIAKAMLPKRDTCGQIYDVQHLLRKCVKIRGKDESLIHKYKANLYDLRALLSILADTLTAAAKSLVMYYVYGHVYGYVLTKQHIHGGYSNWEDIVLYIDVIVMAYVAYYDERSLLVTHPLLTISRYIKHAFLWDVITIFPFERAISIIHDRTDLDLYRMNRIFQVTRITGAFTYWESDIMRVNQAVVLLKFLPWAITVVNLATAFIFINSCKPYLPKDSHFIFANCTRALVISSTKYEIRYAAPEYIHTFYWVFEIFVGCGCTPTAIVNSTDVWLTMILQICGFFYFAFMFGYVASTQSAAAHALLDHNEKTTDLENFLYQQNVDPILTLKTMKYFEYVWKRTNGSNPQQICRRLNSALMEDTLVFMYEKTLREVPLFGKVERSFIRVITQHLHEMYFLKDETVIQCKDIQPYIFIIYRGKVDVLSSYNEMITCMGPGGMFGNFTGQPIACSEVSIYASRSLDLLVIPSNTFFNLVKYYPKIQDPLNKAFEVSRDYILPISMDTNVDEISSEESEPDLFSQDSLMDSRSGSSRFEMPGQLSLRSSQSNVSQAKSSTSVATFHGYLNVYNLFKPGTWLFQLVGYVTCLFATCSYVLALYELVTLNDCYIIFWLSAIFDIFFYIKTYLTMHQGYVSKHGDIIMDAAKCRRKYLKKKVNVWSDVIVNLPLDLFGFCFPNPMRAMHYLRVNRLLRLKYLVEFYRKTAAELTNNLTTLQSAMTVIVAIILIHTLTSIWLLGVMAAGPVSSIRTLKMHIIDEETPQSPWDYTTSFYVVSSELVAIGGDEFIIEAAFPSIILALCLIVGKMLAAIIVATSMQVAYSTKHALINYEKITGELIDVLKNQGLSNYQLKKFWKYVRQLWVTERGRQLPALLEQTPYVRRCDLMSAMFGQHLRNCFLFADTGEPFLRQLTVVLDYTIFFPGNYIVMAGDSEARMYWVTSGTVSVVSVRADLTETTHELLGPGDVFGIMQGLQAGRQHCFSYRAETKVSILTLSLDSWIHILPFFPDAQRIISEKADVLFAQF